MILPVLHRRRELTLVGLTRRNGRDWLHAPAELRLQPAVDRPKVGLSRRKNFRKCVLGRNHVRHPGHSGHGASGLGHRLILQFGYAIFWELLMSGKANNRDRFDSTERCLVNLRARGGARRHERKAQSRERETQNRSRSGQLV